MYLLTKKIISYSHKLKLNVSKADSSCTFNLSGNEQMDYVNVKGKCISTMQIIPIMSYVHNMVQTNKYTKAD